VSPKYPILCQVSSGTLNSITHSDCGAKTRWVYRAKDGRAKFAIYTIAWFRSEAKPRWSALLLVFHTTSNLAVRIYPFPLLLKLHTYLRNHTSKRHQIFLARVACGRSSIIFRRRCCDTSCTSGFVDDAVLAIASNVQCIYSEWFTRGQYWFDIAALFVSMTTGFAATRDDSRVTKPVLYRK